MTTQQEPEHSPCYCTASVRDSHHHTWLAPEHDCAPSVAVAAGTLLPYLTRRDARLLAQEGDEDEDAELTRLRAQVREWRADAARRGKPLRLPIMPFFLRNIWTGAMLLFTFLTLMTAFVTKVWQAIILVSLVGICWAVACWAPFAIIMEVRLHAPLLAGWT